MGKKDDAAKPSERAGPLAAAAPAPERGATGRHVEDIGHAAARLRSPAGRAMGHSSADIAHAALAALDHLSIGVAIVDLRCHVIWTNQYCQEILSESDGLSLIAGELRTSTRKQTARLHQLIDGAGQGCGAGEQAISVMMLARPSGVRPYHVAARVLDRHEPTAEPHLALFIIDPARDEPLAARQIAALFGLTQSESQLAARLAAGKRLDRAADELGVATGTARTHLKHVFQKTDTGRQAELSRLLRALLGRLRWT